MTEFVAELLIISRTPARSHLTSLITSFTGRKRECRWTLSLSTSSYEVMVLLHPPRFGLNNWNIISLSLLLLRYLEALTKGSLG